MKRGDKKRSSTEREGDEAQAKGGLVRAVGGGVVLLAIVLLALNAFWFSKQCGGLRAPHKGSKAPDFSLRDLTGKVHTLSALRGKVVVLDFWATWCPPCVAKVPGLEALADELEGKGLRILAVSVDRSLGQLKRFVGRREAIRKQAGKGPSKVIVLRSNGRVGADYGVHSLPHVTLVDRRGQLRYVHIGGGGLRALRKEVLKALGE